MAKRRITYSFGADLSELERAVKRINSKLGQLGRDAERIGKAMSKAFTIPLAGIGAASTKAAIDFESAFAGVRKTVNATEDEFKALERGIRDMAKEIPASAVEISRVAEAAGQLGIQKDVILSFTRTMIDLGESTNLSAEEAASALAQFANVTQMSQKEFDRLGSVIVALGNNLATTERDIVEMGQRLAGAGKQAGLTEAQIMAIAGALSSVGIEAEAGGSAFSRLLSNMQLAVETNSKSLQNFASVAGMSAAQFKQAFQQDAAGALMAFINGLSSAQSRGISAVKVLDDMGIKEIRLRDALLRAAGASNVFTQALDIGNRAWQENNALTEEARRRYDTAASQLKMLRNRINDVAIDIGGQLVPYILKAVEAVAGLTEEFSRLAPETQKSIIAAAALIGVGGPLMIALNSAITAATSLAALLASIVASPAFPFVAAGGLGLAMGANIAKWQEQRRNAPTVRAITEKRTELAGPAQQIFFQRYGKPPVSAEDYKKLDQIIADLAVNTLKTGESFELLGLKAQTGLAKATGAAKGKVGAGTGTGGLDLTGGGKVKKGGKTAESEYLDRLNWQYQQGLISADKYFAELESKMAKLGSGSKEFQNYFSAKQAAAIDVINERMKALVDGLKTGTLSASEFAAKTEELKGKFEGLPLAQKAITDAASEGMQEYLKQVGAATAADIERINKIKQEQLDAQEAAAEGVAKFWQDVNWEYSQGLIDAQSYFEMLRGELQRATEGSEAWKTAFSELQRVGQDIASIDIKALNEQFDKGKITAEEYRSELEALKAQFSDLPLVVKALDEAIKNVGSNSDKMKDFAKELGMTFESAFENAIVKGEDLRSVMSGLLEDIARIILRMYVVIPLVNSVMGFMTSTFGLPAVKMHGGGVVGAGGTISLVPAGTFIGAPRLHKGLASDEFPAILQKGEVVLPKDFGKTNVDVQPNIRIINVLDPSIVGNYLATPDGEKIIVNVMQKNIRRLT